MEIHASFVKVSTSGTGFDNARTVCVVRDEHLLYILTLDPLVSVM